MNFKNFELVDMGTFFISIRGGLQEIAIHESINWIYAISLVFLFSWTPGIVFLNIKKLKKLIKTFSLKS